MINSIIEILSSMNVSATEEQITATITQAKNLVGMEYFTVTDRTEYVPDFDDEVYVTDFYPVIEESLTITLDETEITPRKVQYSEGIIYLKGTLNGTLEVTYQYGYRDEELNNSLIPLVVELFKSNNNYNLASITEGDVSISYATSTPNGANGINTIDNLVNEIREKYDARIRLL